MQRGNTATKHHWAGQDRELLTIDKKKLNACNWAGKAIFHARLMCYE